MSTKLTITPITTSKFHLGDDLFEFLDKHLTKIVEGDVLVVTSKIVALAEKRVVKKNTGDKSEKHQLVKQEADWWLPPDKSQYNLMLTIKDGTLAVNAGIDESNIDSGYYLLLPKDSYQSAYQIWLYLKKRFQVSRVGVIVSDSMTMPLKWGVFGNALAHCGFKAMVSYVGKKDLFGRQMQMTTINLPQSLAQAAVFAMGEVDEARPLAIVRGVETIAPVEFQDRPPTKKEIKEIYIDLKDDVYEPVLSQAKWKRGRS